MRDFVADITLYCDAKKHGRYLLAPAYFATEIRYLPIIKRNARCIDRTNVPTTSVGRMTNIHLHIATN